MSGFVVEISGVELVSCFAVFVLWMIGFGYAGLIYYADRRGLGPNLWRIAAAVVWPIGIPIDFLFIDKHRRNQRRAQS